jgi:hypothetical protein
MLPLPSQIAVYEADCLQRSNTGNCVIGQGSQRLRIHSGGALNITVTVTGRQHPATALGVTPQNLASSPPLGRVRIHTTSGGDTGHDDNALFLIGNLTATISADGVAAFHEIAFQPVDAPVTKYAVQLHS